MGLEIIFLGVIAWVLYDRYKAGGEVRLSYALACLVSSALALSLTVLAAYELARLPLDWRDLRLGGFYWGVLIWVCALPLLFALSYLGLVRLCGWVLVCLRCITAEQYEATFRRKKTALRKQSPIHQESWVMAFLITLTLIKVVSSCLDALDVENLLPQLSQFIQGTLWGPLWVLGFFLLTLFAFPFLVLIACFDWLFARRSGKETTVKGQTAQ